MKRIGIPVLVVFFCCVSTAWVQAQAQRKPQIIAFDAPDAGSTPGLALGTQGGDINPAGAITGTYADENDLTHGFLRTPQGKLITFDAPGAGKVGGGCFVATPAGTCGGQGTYPFSINPEGAITGFYIDENNLGHGFLRAPDGTFTSFDDSVADTPPGQRTAALNINPAGVIAGNYIDADSVHHGFVRTPDGKFTNFDPSGSVFTFVCVAMCINPAGEVAGDYISADGVRHGFVRAPNGAIAEFDVPQAGTNGDLGQGTYVGSINARGTVAGTYISADNVNHGYLRAPDGRITTFDVPFAGNDGSQGQGTYAQADNAVGAVAGEYIDANDVIHGFVRAPDGSFTYVDAPDAGTQPFQGTNPLTINAAGQVTGAYIDSDGVLHAFVWLAGAPRGRD